MPEHQIISLKDAPASSWAGGSTHQLYIYPQGAEYKRQDFGYRISVAVCEIASSAYTNLPGVERHLLMLKGSAVIRHEGQAAVVLHPYEGIDTFDGGVPTVAEGKVTDFNLMTANGWQGKLEVIDSASLIEPTSGMHSIAFYCHEGEVAIGWDETTLKLLGGELMVIDAPVSAIKVDPDSYKLLCCKLWQPDPQ